MEEFKSSHYFNYLQDALNLTGATQAEALQNTKIAFDIIEAKNIKPIRITFPNAINDMMIIDLDASIEKIIDLNFELAERISILYDDLPKYLIYFSVKREIAGGFLYEH